jgi:predicted ester cyclase
MVRKLFRGHGLLWVALITLVACQPITPTAATSQEQANKAVVQRFYEEVFTQKKMEVLGELFAANFIIHDLDVGGEAGGATLLQDTLPAFPDVQATVNLWVVQDDLVTTSVSYTGTHQAEFLGVAPTGKTVTWHIIDLWRVQDGKLIELWHDVPNGDILEQIQPQASSTITDGATAAPVATPIAGAAAPPPHLPTPITPSSTM